jgi:ATP dependent DNA ligase domain
VRPEFPPLGPARPGNATSVGTEVAFRIGRRLLTLLPSALTGNRLVTMLWRTDRPRPLPLDVISPCLPTPAPRPPSGPVWVHEVKYDGYRLVARLRGERVRLFTRRATDWTHRFLWITEAVASLEAHSATIDGEAVCCGTDGMPDFDLASDTPETGSGLQRLSHPLPSRCRLGIDSPMPKRTDPVSEPLWGIYQIRKTGARLGTVPAPDEQTALAKAAEEFGISPALRSRLVARREG